MMQPADEPDSGRVMRPERRTHLHREQFRSDVDAAADHDIEPRAERLDRGLLDTSVVIDLDITRNAGDFIGLEDLIHVVEV